VSLSQPAVELAITKLEILKTEPGEGYEKVLTEFSNGKED